MSANVQRPIERVMPEAFRPADRIVVPVQGTDREFLAQQWAVEFAAALGVPVCAVHVSSGAGDVPDEDEIFSYVGEEAMKWGVPIETHVLAGGLDPVQAILDELKVRDLVVIGTRRLGGTFHVGSVTAELVRRAPCPVQVLRIG